ncbi:hypothetical protein OO013_19475 [Mangrovivirga sp. M17]|uniref:Tetratricopeptide repeat protein n=1 Tax=Mangrovivirga halotolerans TaxID=2993936 RepID=A0ABT3RXI3_9BACT|nr:hypothetical protein [Mangrovivirga halotolerans]MCX2746068.1 hypothetical protein [Mangrovivirga halotolerans]
MRIILFTILSFFTITFISANNIAEINKLKKEATEAFKNKNYEVAIEKFTILKDSFNVKEEGLLLNLAHSYWQSGDTTQAQGAYSNLLDAKDKKIRSIAYQQTGSISFHKKNLESAIAMYKQSLLADPYNEQARYDFELAMKKLKEEEEKKKQQQKQDQNKDQENKDQQKQDQQNKDQKGDENKNKTGEEKEDKSKKEEQEKAENQEADQKKEQENDGKAEKDDEDQKQNDETDKEKLEKMKKLREKLKEMNMSEEKAQMILEALQNNEVQYLKQMQRKSTKDKDDDKPDW